MTGSDTLTLDVGQVIARHLDPDRLTQYWNLLMAENQKVNLVSRETSREAFDRMVAESLMPLDLLSSDFDAYLDIGSGGGLPALVLLLTGRINGETWLVERTQKKTAALGRMLESLSLQALPMPRTFEEVPLTRKFDLITLRYVKLTPQLLRRILPALSPTGIFAYYSKPEFDLAFQNATVVSYRIGSENFVKSLTLFRR